MTSRDDSLARVQTHARERGWEGHDRLLTIQDGPSLRRAVVALRLARGSDYVEAYFVQDQRADTYRLQKAYGWRVGDDLPSVLWGLDQNNRSNLLRFLD